jgi:hypothetical protein
MPARRDLSARAEGRRPKPFTEAAVPHMWADRLLWVARGTRPAARRMPEAAVAVSR